MIFFLSVSISFLCCIKACNISQAGSAAELVYPFNIAVSQQDVAKSRLGYERKKYNHSFASFSLMHTCAQAWGSGVSMAIIGHDLDFLSLSLNHLCPPSSCELNSCTDCWSHRNTAFQTWILSITHSQLSSLYIDHWQNFILWLRGSKTPDTKTVGPTTPGQL